MGPCHAPKASQNNNSICRIRVGRMNQLEHDELKDKSDDFSRRLDAQVAIGRSEVACTRFG